MGAKSYKVRALVLKKTKLAEKDLIVTMLAEDGSLVKGVAKGARKPGGSFAARLELFSTVDLLMIQGRSLDIVREARLVDAFGNSGTGLELTLCAALIAELLSVIAQPDLPQPRIFDMARAAYAHLAANQDDSAALLAITSAAVWKIMSQIGFRPSFAVCALCGSPLEAGESQSFGPADFPQGKRLVSVEDGGAICGACQRPADAQMVDYATVSWCDAFIRLTFDDIRASGIDVARSVDTLHLAQQWALVHTGKRLKSADALLTSGLF